MQSTILKPSMSGGTSMGRNLYRFITKFVYQSKSKLNLDQDLL